MKRTRYSIGSFGVVLQNEEKIIKTLHVSQMVNPDEYAGITQQRDALMQRVEKFLLKQEKAGLLSPFVIGGLDGQEVYPSIEL
jgi:hypothetical protein